MRKFVDLHDYFTAFPHVCMSMEFTVITHLAKFELSGQLWLFMHVLSFQDINFGNSLSYLLMSFFF